MSVDRRTFLKVVGLTTVSAASVNANAKQKEPLNSEDQVGCLVDTTKCIGCRKCEEACNRSNHLPSSKTPFDDTWVLRERRRPDATHFTVINSYPGNPSPVQHDQKQTTIKVQCMHCLEPACVSACIVGALNKNVTGPVTYDSDKCIGCRYCMVACPFEIPAYEYTNPLSPKVMKCGYCVDEQKNTGAAPACAAACPTEAIIFGKRTELLDLARQRIKDKPDRYEEHIYGEKEVGGTSWLYLTGRPAKELDLPALQEKAPPRLSESIQHGIFNYGAIPLAFYGSLAGIMWLSNRKNKTDSSKTEEEK